MQDVTSEGSTRDDESGVALFYALLVVLVVGGIIAVTFASALSQTRQSAFELDFEDTLHVAESGTEVVLQELSTDSDFSNATNPLTSGLTEADWAISQALAAPAADLIDLGEGEAIGLRPATGASEFVYGVGFVPSRAAFVNDLRGAQARVVRIEVAFTDVQAPGTYVFLSDRVLTVNGGGTSSIYGSNGSAHTNGNLNPPSSSNFETEGAMSYVGSCGSCTSSGSVTYVQTSTVVPINVGTPDELYATDVARDYVSNGGNWYDRCASGWHVRTDPDGTPCSGALVGVVPGFSTTTQSAGGGGADGVYWFEGDQDITLIDDDVTMTVITGGDIDLPNGNNSFDWAPAYPRLHAYSGGDVDWKNNDVNATGITCSGGLSASERATASTVEPGIVYAANSVTLSGNPTTVQIAFLTDGDILLNGGGNKCFVLETDASGDLGGEGVPILTEWDELR